MQDKIRIVFGISGASGFRLALAMLEAYTLLPELEIHLVISENALLALEAEGVEQGRLAKLKVSRHGPAELGAPAASGSWQTNGMVICPCSMATLGAIANGCGQNLIHRAADVTLKEGRPLVLAPRETPLSLIHLRNMRLACEAGATIMPFMPAFYTGEASLEGMMRQFSGRVLDQLRVPNTLCARWKGTVK